MNGLCQRCRLHPWQMTYGRRGRFCTACYVYLKRKNTDDWERSGSVVAVTVAPSEVTSHVEAFLARA